MEKAASTNTGGFLETKAVSLLRSSSYNPSAIQIALDALGGVDLQYHWPHFLESWDGDLKLVENQLTYWSPDYPSISDPDAIEKERKVKYMQTPNRNLSSLVFQDCTCNISGTTWIRRH